MAPGQGLDQFREPGGAESMCGIRAKKSRDRLDNGLLIDVPGIFFVTVFAAAS
jgi:hypothetical protein